MTVAHPEEMPGDSPKCDAFLSKPTQQALSSRWACHAFPSSRPGTETIIFQVKTPKLREIQNVSHIKQLPGGRTGNWAEFSQFASGLFPSGDWGSWVRPKGEDVDAGGIHSAIYCWVTSGNYPTPLSIGKCLVSAWQSAIPTLTWRNINYYSLYRMETRLVGWGESEESRVGL